MNDKTDETKVKKPLSVDILFLGVVTLIAVGSWVIFDVYRSLTVSTIPRVQQRQIRPLKSTIDDDLFNNLKTRRRFSETELNSVTPKPYVSLEERSRGEPTPTPVPQLLVTPVASPTAQLSPTPVATQSGGIGL